MSEPIKAGDLVMCVNACCDEQRNKHLGKIRVVAKVAVEPTCCPYCKHVDWGIHVIGDKKKGSPIWWCKKIDPPKESQDERHDEEIAA